MTTAGFMVIHLKGVKMPKWYLGQQEVLDLREDHELHLAEGVVRTILDVDDGPGAYWTWLISFEQPAKPVTYWRTMYRITGQPGDMCNSLFDQPLVCFEQVPNIPTVVEGYVRFDDGAVEEARRAAEAAGQAVAAGEQQLADPTV